MMDLKIEDGILLKRAWAGWAPVEDDEDLKRAYRELFVALNADRTAKTRWPPDGRYEYSEGKMSAVAVRGGGK